jgi:hypothetical protein
MGRELSVTPDEPSESQAVLMVRAPTRACAREGRQ